MGSRIAIGIVVIVVLMLSLTVAGVSYMSQVNVRMNDIVNNNNAKMEMAYIMQIALRERALNMYIMTIVDDDFLKDDEYQRFNIHAAAYYQARKKMEELASTPKANINFLAY